MAGLGYTGSKAQLHTGWFHAFSPCSIQFKYPLQSRLTSQLLFLLVGISSWAVKLLRFDMPVYIYHYSFCSILEWPIQMARPFHLDLSSLRCHWWVPDISTVNHCETIYTGYVLAITADNNLTRYIAVFFMAAGVFVFFSLFSRIVTHWIQTPAFHHRRVFCRFRSILILQVTFVTDGNCFSSILPNNSSGHYKKASTTALQVVIANFRCVLSL